MLVAHQQMLVAQNQLNASVATQRAFRHAGALETTHMIKWAFGVGAGEVTIEAADREDDPDGWSPVGVATFTNRATLPYTDVVRVQGHYRALRHRITAPVVDGSVSSWLTAAGDAA